MNIKVSILGTEYSITIRKYSEDTYFSKNEASGYCDGINKEIVLCDMSTFPGWEDEDKADCHAQEDFLLRHEVVHAFLNESGLAENSNDISAWARNEEMVDWFAMQGPKIFKVWQELDILWPKKGEKSNDRNYL